MVGRGKPARGVPLREPSVFYWPAIGLLVLAVALVVGIVIH